MKSIKDISWKVTEKEYRKSPNISYSLLSAYSREGSSALLNRNKKISTDALRFGSLTDIIVTEPHELDNVFLITNCKIPSGIIFNIIIDLYNESNCMSFSELSEDIILETINKFKYYPNWKDTTRIDKITSEGNEYYDKLCLAGERTIMTSNDYNRALQCVEVLKNNPYTSKYFKDEDNAFYQLKFRLEVEKSELEIPCDIKCMFDRIIVDEVNKVIQPVDLKTTGNPEEEFEDSFVHWRYDIQATMYWYILYCICKNDEYYRDFTVLPFKFVCINRWLQKPLVWNYPDTTAFVRKIGIDGKIYKPWCELLKEVYYIMSNNKYEYSYESYINKGERELKSLKIYE